MIILSIGSNISSIWGSRYSTVEKSINKLEDFGIKILKISSIYHSPPMTLLTKKSLNIEILNEDIAKADNFSKFDYLNLCVLIETSKSPLALLYCLKQIEKDAGRVKGQRWSSRPLDIDIISYHDIQIGNQVEYNKASNHGHLPLSLPHPGLKMRNFVLKPLQEIAPFWHHPVTGEAIHKLIGQLK